MIKLQSYPTEQVHSETPDGAYWSRHPRELPEVQIIVVGQMQGTPADYRDALEQEVHCPLDYKSRAFMDVPKEADNEVELKHKQRLVLDRGFISFIFQMRGAA